MDTQKDERLIVSFLVIATIFILVNVNSDVGVIYSFMTLTYLIAISSSKFKEVEIISSKASIIASALIAFVLLGFWLLFVNYGLSLAGMTESVSGDFISTDVFAKLNAFTEVPVLSSSQTVRVAVWGVLIPIIESLFALSFVLLFFAELFKMRAIKLHSFKTRFFVPMVWIAFLVGSVLSIFHGTARVYENIALIIDFLFFAFSALLVFASPQLHRLIGSTSPKAFMLIPMFLHIYINTGSLLFGR